MGKPNRRTSEARDVIAATHIFSWISDFVSFSACVFHTIWETFCVEEIRSSGKPSVWSEAPAWPRLPCRLSFYLMNAAVSTFSALVTCHSAERSGAR